MDTNKNTDKFKVINKDCDKRANLFMLQHEQLSAEGFDAPPPAGSTIRYDLIILLLYNIIFYNIDTYINYKYNMLYIFLCLYIVLDHFL